MEKTGEVMEKWLNGISDAVLFVRRLGGNDQKVNLLATWALVYTLTLVCILMSSKYGKFSKNFAISHVVCRYLH